MQSPSPLLACLAAAAFVGVPSLVKGADHLDAPNVQGNGNVDINDLYAFQSPTNPDNSVLILTVNPGAGALSPRTFGTDVTYEFAIDNTGDAVEDVVYSANFADIVGGQSVTITRNGVPYGAGTTGTAFTNGTGSQIATGVYDDPFFFDFNGFNDGLNFTGDDFFAGLDTSAIVLELPSSELNGADSNIGVWGRTIQGGDQVDRIGRPAINTVLLPEGRKTEFNLADPSGDSATFGDDVNAAIAGLSDQANADALTPVLLPDVLTFDTSLASGFLNGRQLADDVIDAELGLLSDGALTTDGVDSNDRQFLDVFPYLASANVPEPTSVVLAVAALTAGLVRRRV